MPRGTHRRLGLVTLVGRIVGPLLGRRRLQGVFERCHELGVRGMNLDADTDPNENGERAFLAALARDPERAGRPWIVFDVGANVGDWTAMASDVLGARGIAHRIFAFEPGAQSHALLAERVATVPGVEPVRLALGSEEGQATLRYDHGASVLASLYERRVVRLEREERVDVTTVDAFSGQRGVERIDLLKLDVEGHELAVLRGASSMLADGAVDVVQFEFGGTHVDARVFLRDLLDALGPGYQVSRIVRDGVRPLGPWRERLELFRLGNYVALLRPPD